MKMFFTTVPYPILARNRKFKRKIMDDVHRKAA